MIKMTMKQYSIIQDRIKVGMLINLLEDILPENNGIINYQEHKNVVEIVRQWNDKLYDMPGFIE
jgi:hypothetical protein